MAKGSRFFLRWYNRSMTMWAAKCKKCGKLAAVRPSKSAGRQLDLRNPSEKIEKLACPHCGAVNDFLGSDLEEVLAYIGRSQPKS
jgi:hypothetical protein